MTLKINFAPDEEAKRPKNIPNNLGLTPLQIAEERGGTTLVKLFHSLPIEREAP